MIEAVLSQKHQGILYPEAFIFWKINVYTINYDVQDKEILANVSLFKKWQQYLQGSMHPISVFSNFEILKYFDKKKILVN